MGWNSRACSRTSRKLARPSRVAFPLKEGQDFEIDIEDAGKLTARVARTVEGRAGVRFTKTAKEASRDALAYFGAGEEKEPIDRILKMINS